MFKKGHGKRKVKKMKAEHDTRLAEVQGQNTIGALEIQALIEATQAQSSHTGIAWIDALSALMRPIITFWWVIVLCTAHEVVECWSLLEQGATHYFMRTKIVLAVKWTVHIQ